MIIFAKLINFLLHPVVLITPSVFLIIAASGGSIESAFFWSSIALGFVLFISLYIYAGMKFGFFSNFDVSKREQRIYLFPVVLFAGVTFLFSLIAFNGPRALFLAIIYFLISVAILALVNLKVKASIHVGSITAATVSAVYFFGDQYLFLLVLIPIMAWARVREKRHTLRETIVGFFLGFLLALFGIFSVQYLM